MNHRICCSLMLFLGGFYLTLYPFITTVYVLEKDQKRVCLYGNFALEADNDKEFIQRIQHILDDNSSLTIMVTGDEGADRSSELTVLHRLIQMNAQQNSRFRYLIAPEKQSEKFLGNILYLMKLTQQGQTQVPEYPLLLEKAEQLNIQKIFTTFVNEVGALCTQFSIEAHSVLSLQDKYKENPDKIIQHLTDQALYGDIEVLRNVYKTVEQKAYMKHIIDYFVEPTSTLLGFFSGIKQVGALKGFLIAEGWQEIYGLKKDFGALVPGGFVNFIGNVFAIKNAGQKFIVPNAYLYTITFDDLKYLSRT